MDEMKVKVTKRDLLFFFTGVVTMLLISFVWNWKSNTSSFGEGVREGFNEATKETGR